MPSTATAVGATVELRLFQAGDAAAFLALNEAWIERLFKLEEHDREVLGDPVKYIMEPGGQIVIAVDAGVVVGCCGLMPMEPGVFEVAKMAVDERYQGRGVGRKVLARVIEEGRAMGAKRLYLETNHQLENAIHLYEALGFKHLPPTESPYARADVFMEMWL
jgi:putative acetyltransferase